MSEELSNINTFWFQIVKAGETALLNAPVNNTITITNAVIPDVTETTEKKAVRLYATVNTLTNTEEEEKDERAANNDYTTDEILVASLTPFKNECQALSIVFSPLNIVKFHNKGALDVHLSGIIFPNEEEVEIFDGEEDAEEDKTEKKELKDERISATTVLEEKKEEKEDETEEKPVVLSADEIQKRFAKMAKEQGPRQLPEKKSKKELKKEKKRRMQEEEEEEEDNE